jgi:hypothetical protein
MEVVALFHGKVRELGQGFLEALQRLDIGGGPRRLDLAQEVIECGIGFRRHFRDGNQQGRVNGAGLA